MTRGELIANKQTEWCNAACNFCGNIYNEDAAEFKSLDRSCGQLCLSCQTGALVSIGENHESEFHVVPIEAAAEEINDVWYSAYTEFSEEEYTRLQAEIDALPVASGTTLEELQQTTAAAMAALSEFYNSHTELLNEWRKPCEFSLTVEAV